MAKKLRGMLCLSDIDKELVFTTNSGKKVIWIDVIERKGGVDAYGNTHNISTYDKKNGKTVYLGNLRPEELNFGSSSSRNAQHASAPQEAPAVEEDDNDLPF